MTREEAIRKMEFCKNAYQKLIDEEVDNGTFVGTGVNGVWKADTPLTKAYSDMVDACDMAIKALDQEPCEDATLKDIFCMGCEYKEQEPCEDAVSRQAVIEAIEDDNRNGLYSCFASDNDAQCFKEVIRKLPPVNPQEPIIDKIRAEIARLRDSWEKDNYHDEADALTTALAILDKYKVQEGKA